MKNKLLLVLASALIVGLAAPAWAQTAATPTTPAPAATTPAAAPAPAAPSSSWVLTPAFVSEYMFRGVRLGGPSFQPAIEFDSGNLALGVWTNFPISDKVDGQSDPEIDPYGSYKFVISDSFNIQPGFTWYNYPQAEKSNGFYKSTFEPSIAVNWTFSGLTLTPKAYYDFVLKGPTGEISAAYALPLKDMGTELDFLATIGTYKWDEAFENSSPSTKNWGNYWLAQVGMPFQIAPNQKLTLAVGYTKGTDNFIKTGTAPKTENAAAQGKTVFTLSYAFTF